jgi:hypothetical protein
MMGMNIGVAKSAELGPRAACENLRFQFFVCEGMRE